MFLAFSTHKETKIVNTIPLNVILLNAISLSKHINRTYHFYNDQIDLKDFDARLLKIDKKDYNEFDIY